MTLPIVLRTRPLNMDWDVGDKDVGDPSSSTFTLFVTVDVVDILEVVLLLLTAEYEANTVEADTVPIGILSMEFEVVELAACMVDPLYDNEVMVLLEAMTLLLESTLAVS